MDKPRDFKFQIRCSFCTSNVQLEVNIQDYEDWFDGKLAQDAFPYLSASEREIMISRMCGDCFDNIFKETD